MKTLFAILLMITASRAGEGRRWGHLEWIDDRGISPAPIIAWEVQLSVSFVGPWDVFAVVYAPEAPLAGLPDGIYFARILALGAGGIAGPPCRPIRFAVPAPDPIPPVTHARLTVQRSTDGVKWATIAIYDDPISTRAFYRLESSLITK